MVEQVINVTRAFSSQTLREAKDHLASGTWNGLTVRVRQEKDIDSEIRKTEYRQRSGLDAPTDRKTLGERTLSLDARSLPISADTLRKLAKVFGGDIETTKLAQSYLKHFLGQQSMPKQDGSLNNLLQHYVALNKLSSALQGNQGDFIAKMTPGNWSDAKLEVLAQKLQEAGDDPAKMKALLAETEGLPEDPDELHAMMKTLRFNPEALKNKLRDAQGLPDLDQNQLKALREQLDDALLQLEIDDGSRIKLARNSIEKGFETGDPERFVESYSGALQHAGNFLHTFTALIKRHTTAELRHIIPLMKQTLADELQLDQEERSTDKIKLESLLSELSFMHISTTLIEKIDSLLKGLQRIYGQPAAA